MSASSSAPAAPTRPQPSPDPPAVYSPSPRPPSGKPPGPRGPGRVVRACPAAKGPGLYVLPGAHLYRSARSAVGAARPGLVPTELQAAYDLPSQSAGRGQTVAVIDAYNDSHAASDLAAYRAAWGLPECTVASGCFRQVNQDGQAGPLPAAAGATGWAVEESLDLDMVSAVCPNCRILLVEADSNRVPDLGAAVDAAVVLGAKYISNGYAGPEFPGETADNAFYDHPGTAITAGAGNEPGQVTYPAAAPYVTSVGGTTLAPASSGTWSQRVWTGQLGTGSGCSAYEPRPAWQAGPAVPGGRTTTWRRWPHRTRAWRSMTVTTRTPGGARAAGWKSEAPVPRRRSLPACTRWLGRRRPAPAQLPTRTPRARLCTTCCLALLRRAPLRVPGNPWLQRPGRLGYPGRNRRVHQSPWPSRRRARPGRLATHAWARPGPDARQRGGVAH